MKDVEQLFVSKKAYRLYIIGRVFNSDLIAELTGYLLSQPHVSSVELEAIERFMQKATDFYNSYMIGKLVRYFERRGADYAV
jgi:hypothetical protein